MEYNMTVISKVQVHQEDSKACEYKKVISLDLKDSTEGADLTAKGMLFHSLGLGAVAAKAQSTLSFILVVGAANKQ